MGIVFLLLFNSVQFDCAVDVVDMVDAVIDEMTAFVIYHLAACAEWLLVPVLC